MLQSVQTPIPVTVRWKVLFINYVLLLTSIIFHNNAYCWLQEPGNLPKIKDLVSSGAKILNIDLLALGLS